MDNHNWTERGRRYVLDAARTLYEEPDAGEAPQAGEVPAFVAREMMRLAEKLEIAEPRVRELQELVRTSGEGEAIATAEEQRLNALDRVAELEALYLPEEDRRPCDGECDTCRRQCGFRLPELARADRAHIADLESRLEIAERQAVDNQALAFLWSRQYDALLDWVQGPSQTRAELLEELAEAGLPPLPSAEAAAEIREASERERVLRDGIRSLSAEIEQEAVGGFRWLRRWSDRLLDLLDGAGPADQGRADGVGTTRAASPDDVPRAKPQTYVAGFAVDDEHQTVALVRKSHPSWQAGRLNGVGGHIEPGETPAEAMTREFQEETGTPISSWREVVVLSGKGFRVHFFVALVGGSTMQALVGAPDEPIEVHPLENLPYLSVIPNLRWIIPLCLDPDLIVAEAWERPAGGQTQGEDFGLDE